MSDTLKIRCLFGREEGDYRWILLECLEHEAWACGVDFKKENTFAVDWRELNVEIDNTEVQRILGETTAVKGAVQTDD